MSKKRLFAALFCLIITMPIIAQYDHYRYGRPVQHETKYSDDHNIYYGLRLGVALANVNSDDDELDGGGIQAGLNLGAIIGFQLSPSAPVYLESGIYYTEKGGKGYQSGKKFTYDLNYLEMPILIKYRCELDYDLSVQPFAGGYLAMGVSGKVKDYGEEKAYSSFSSNFFKRFDGGLRLGCGIEYQILYADISYEFGLANICHSDFETSHNGCFYITAGVNF